MAITCQSSFTPGVDPGLPSLKPNVHLLTKTCLRDLFDALSTYFKECSKPLDRMVFRVPVLLKGHLEFMQALLAQYTSEASVRASE